MEPLQLVIDEIGQSSSHRLAEAPVMEELAGFGRFLQNLKNQGMHPYLMGDFPVEPAARSARPRRRRPYVVNK